MRRPISLAACLLTASLAAAQADPHAAQQAREIKALSPAEIDDLLAGRGMGLARAAELNGYAGPAHVLELADRLGLTPAQIAATQALFARMSAEARALGAAIVDAERDLDAAFGRRAIDEDSLRAKVDAVAALQGRLRAVHLRAHLAQAALLSPEQIARYDALRGYAGPAPHGGRRH